MPRTLWPSLLILASLAVLANPVTAQESSGWRISPEGVNIIVGSRRRLQVLNDSAQELQGAVWSVDDPSIAEISDDGTLAVLHATAAGTVHVSASIGNDTKYIDVKVWPAVSGALPEGTTRWTVHQIGRDIGDIAAVPSSDGPEFYTVEQKPDGETYVRAIEPDGIQMWSWKLPEQTRNVKLVCGDWLGGAVVSVDHPDSFTLYFVGRDGQLRWKHTWPGQRNPLAINVDSLMYLVTQSPDGLTANVDVYDEASGVLKFELPLPDSTENLVHLRRDGEKYYCSADSSSSPMPDTVTGPFVNMDGFAYIAFSQTNSTIEAPKCHPGEMLQPSQLQLTREQNLMLWQIHKDGTYRATLANSLEGQQPLSSPIASIVPTKDILTDNMNGILIPVQVTHSNGPAEQFVYRVDPDGNLLLKIPLPSFSGALRDEMVIGEKNVGFATRGSLLVAVDLQKGTDLWSWDSHEPGISVFAALADGGCLVQTPTALVEVKDGAEVRELMKGKGMITWTGRILRIQ